MHNAAIMVITMGSFIDHARIQLIVTLPLAINLEHVNLSANDYKLLNVKTYLNIFFFFARRSRVSIPVLCNACSFLESKLW